VNTGTAVLKINGLVPLDVTLAARSTVQPSYTMLHDSLSATSEKLLQNLVHVTQLHNLDSVYILKICFFNLYVYTDSSKQHTANI